MMRIRRLVPVLLVTVALLFVVAAVASGEVPDTGDPISELSWWDWVCMWWDHVCESGEWLW